MILCVVLDAVAAVVEQTGRRDQRVPAAASEGIPPAPGASSDAMLAAVLESAPRVVFEPPFAWLDVRGLDVEVVHADLRRRLRRAGVTARSGAAYRPIVAQVAAVTAAADGLTKVDAAGGAAFLSARPLTELGLTDPLLGWLADVGIGRCGELASVAREAVEVRFGADAVRWWRLARGDDDRRLFRPVPPEQPSAGVDFIDYVVTDPERLLFAANALLGGLCEQMRERGVHARRLRLRLPLANGEVWQRTLRTARPTADRAAWLRLARALLERLTVPDAVAGIGVEVESTEAAASVQGDLFDTGFATAGAVEGAVARLLEDQGDVVREAVVTEHVLAEQRGSYRPLSVREALSRPAAAEPAALTLQLLPEPRHVSVETVRRRDHEAPVRYRDGRWHALIHAAGPDRVSGGQWDRTYAREYFRAVTTDGTLVWLYRDACSDAWFLHGWWD
jgi:protein ImuB